MHIIANAEANRPWSRLFCINGFLINDFVAPTNCMVLIKKRLEYIDKRIDELISAMAIALKNKLNKSSV